MTTEVVIKKWGNSLGAVFPKEFVKEHKLKANEKVNIDIVKIADLSEIFGILPRKMSGQKMKDLARSGWEK